MLIVGAGVIGTVYGAHVAAAGHQVPVLRHGPRTGEVAAGGMRARDVLDGERVEVETGVVPDASGITTSSSSRSGVISWPRPARSSRSWPESRPWSSSATTLPGLAAIPDDLPGDAYLGFPGVGGVMTDGTADYVRIRQQPTALQRSPDSRLAALESALSSRGFAIQRVADMDGWLACHAAFIACVAAALYRCGTDPVRLAENRPVLALMCEAITEAFAELRGQGTAGIPRNLSVLHSPLLKPVAVRYWARTMRSPMGELCFAGHSRHAETEMRALGRDMAARITSSPALTELLSPLERS